MCVDVLRRVCIVCIEKGVCIEKVCVGVSYQR